MSSPESMNDGQILDLIAEMISDAEIGLYPERNDNGADAYVCPCCGKTTQIKGYAYGMSHLDSGQHEPDCKLVRLAAALKARNTDDKD